MPILILYFALKTQNSKKLSVINKPSLVKRQFITTDCNIFSTDIIFLHDLRLDKVFNVPKLH